MPIQRRHKYILAALALYWPTLFALTHMPVQEIARRSGMDDKVMHILAYFGLVFLVWSAVSPYGRVDWGKAKVWGVLAIVIWYGVVDELLQAYVGRQAEVQDFLADMAGAVAALGILSVFQFWSAVLVAVGAFIYTLTNYARLDLIWDMPYLNVGLHFFGYALLAVAWIHRYGRCPGTGKAGWFLIVTAVPLAFLGIVKTAGMLLHAHPAWLADSLAGVMGILLAAAFSGAVFRMGRRHRQSRGNGV